MYQFKVDKIVGAGYYPFKGIVSKILSHFDKSHTAFITLKAYKKIEGDKLDAFKN